MSLLNLFKYKYWFSQPLPADGGVKWFWLCLFLGMILASIVLLIVRNKETEKFSKEIYRRLSNLSLVVGGMGLMWAFFRQAYVPFLAFRFWLLFIGLIFALWLGKILFYLFRRVPQIKKANLEREAIKKYLP